MGITSDMTAKVTAATERAAYRLRGLAAGAGAVQVPMSTLAGVFTPTLDAIGGFHADASIITSGVLAPERLGSGAPSDAAFLRGDGLWVEVGTPDAPDYINGGTF